MKPKSEIKREITCRICLCDAKVLKSLHDKFRDQEKSILETINFVVNIDMQLKRDLPNKICDDCMTKLTMADVFKRRCLDSEEILEQYQQAYKNEEFLEESFKDGPVTYFNEKESKCPLQNLDDLIKNKYNLAAYVNVTLTKNKESNTIEPDNIKYEDDSTSSILVKIEPLDDDTEDIDSNDAISADKPLIKPAKSCHGTAVKSRKKKEKEKNSFCGAEYRSEIAIKAHRYRKHSVKAVGEFECPICLKKYVSKNKLSHHMSSVHIDDIDTKGIKTKVSCDKCNREFKLKGSLNRHMKKVHGPEYPCVVTDVASLAENRQLCTLCGKLLSQTALRDHILRHKNIKAFHCDLCAKSFITKEDLKIHIRSHTGAHPYPCSICGKRYATSSNRARHLRSHSDDKPYACQNCPKSFRDSIQLERHARTHTGEKPYKCALCDAAFPRSHHLIRHMRSRHANDTPNIAEMIAAVIRKPGRPPLFSMIKSEQLESVSVNK